MSISLSAIAPAYTLTSAARACSTFLLAFALIALPGATTFAAELNDTGITTFGNASQNDLATEPSDYPGQDASYGRDAEARAGTLTKIGAGDVGFDYTKIANNGNTLPASATLGNGPTDWACTKDNVSGIFWEVKTTDDGLRDKKWTYTWYSSNSTTDGGDAGTSSGGSCYIYGRCDTEKYTADVNAAGLCGYSDWHVPTKKQLLSIVHYGRVNPSIDTLYFPNTNGSSFWSASAYAYNSGYAWGVHFGDGSAYYGNESGSRALRLARAGQ